MDATARMLYAGRLAVAGAAAGLVAAAVSAALVDWLPAGAALGVVFFVLAAGFGIAGLAGGVATFSLWRALAGYVTFLAWGALMVTFLATTYRRLPGQCMTVIPTGVVLALAGLAFEKGRRVSWSALVAYACIGMGAAVLGRLLAAWLIGNYEVVQKGYDAAAGVIRVTPGRLAAPYAITAAVFWGAVGLVASRNQTEIPILLPIAVK